MWKLTEWGKTRTGLPEVPWRDLTDEEYASALSLYPVLPERGYFVQDEPGPAPETEAETDASEIIGGRPSRRKGA